MPDPILIDVARKGGKYDARTEVYLHHGAQVLCHSPHEPVLNCLNGGVVEQWGVPHTLVQAYLKPDGDAAIVPAVLEALQLALKPPPLPGEAQELDVQRMLSILAADGRTAQFFPQPLQQLLNAPEGPSCPGPQRLPKALHATLPKRNKRQSQPA